MRFFCAGTLIRFSSKRFILQWQRKCCVAKTKALSNEATVEDLLCAHVHTCRIAIFHLELCECDSETWNQCKFHHFLCVILALFCANLHVFFTYSMAKWWFFFYRAFKSHSLQLIFNLLNVMLQQLKFSCTWVNLIALSWQKAANWCRMMK